MTLVVTPWINQTNESLLYLAITLLIAFYLICPPFGYLPSPLDAKCLEGRESIPLFYTPSTYTAPGILQALKYVILYYLNFKMRIYSCTLYIKKTLKILKIKACETINWQDL